jgi:hypothetical protein
MEWIMEIMILWLLFYRAITIENLKSTFITLDLKTADLDPYLGVYKRYFSFGNNSYKDNTKLMAQATGQGVSINSH